MADLDRGQKNSHFQKKWGLKKWSDVPVRSFWSCKNQDFGVAEKFRNRQLKPPTPMCILRNSTPKQKKLLPKRSSYEEDIVVSKLLLLLFFLNHCRASKKQMALDFASDIRFGWNKIRSRGFWTLWMWCKCLICTSKNQSSPAKNLSYGPMAKKIWKIM